MMQDSDCFDPYGLPIWKPAKDRPFRYGPLEYSFNQTFSVSEKTEANLSVTGASMGKDPHYDARQTLLSLAKMADENKITRAIIQVDDDTEAMVVDIVPSDILCTKTLPDSVDPLLMVRVAYHTGDPNNPNPETMLVANALMKTMPPNGAMQVKCCSTEEMKILNTSFKENSEKLSAGFVKKFEARLPKKLRQVPGTYTTFLAPLYIKESKKTAKGICLNCGAPSKNFCGKCKVAKYCTKDCQKKHWKAGHKKECLTPEEKAVSEAKTGACSTSDLWIDIDPNLTPEKMRMNASISNHVSVRDMQKKVSYCDAWNVFDGMKKDKVMTLKVQVQPGSSASQQMPILIYPEGKKFNIYSVPENVVNGMNEYIKLDNVVRLRGTDAGLGMGNCKIYLEGYIKQDGQLRIMLNQVKPLQRW